MTPPDRYDESARSVEAMRPIATVTAANCLFVFREVGCQAVAAVFQGLILLHERRGEPNTRVESISAGRQTRSKSLGCQGRPYSESLLSLRLKYYAASSVTIITFCFVAIEYFICWNAYS